MNILFIGGDSDGLRMEISDDKTVVQMAHHKMGHVLPQIYYRESLRGQHKTFAFFRYEGLTVDQALDHLIESHEFATGRKSG